MAQAKNPKAQHGRAGIMAQALRGRRAAFAKIGFGLLLAAGLGACVETGAVSGAARSVTLLNGQVKVTPPSGYCVDTKTSQSRQDSAVVLIGKCSGASAAVPALITTSIGAAGSAGAMAAGPKALAEFFQSTAGRAALARDGRAASVKVAQIANADDVLLLQLQDRAIGSYWRAVFGVKGRLVTLSVQAPEAQNGASSTLSPAEGRRILDAAVAAMRRANG